MSSASTPRPCPPGFSLRSGSELLSLPISALQHWLFCPRQWALIHIERLWSENQFTAEGRLLHEQVDRGHLNRRATIRILRAVTVSSDRYGLHGVADVVELHGNIPFPVEYKRGRPKAHRADEVQLCAQALCLEEAFQTAVPEGALFYGQSRRRQPVCFDEGLRELTITTADEVRNAFATGRNPAPSYVPKRCDRCSLFDLCRPKQMSRPPRVSAWMQRAIAAIDPPA